jgi:predicted flap endonuclease-1-like 5' DNA nuclease
MEAEPAPSTSARKIQVAEIEGIGPTYATSLAAAGIQTTEDLLDAGATPAGRDRLVQATGLSHVNLLKWVNMADLMRVPGIGEEYSQLLEVAGVDTVKELRTRNPINLHKALLDASAERNLVRRPPNLSEVEAWVAAAGTLEPKVTY